MTGRDATPLGDATWPEPFTVSWVADTGSTNADLIAAAREGAPHGAVLVADHQRAGRGRLGRVWSAPPGAALLCSILLRVPTGSERQGSVWAVGLAAKAAARDVAAVEAELKWPNDLMVGDRKLAGILAEGTVSAAGADPADAIVVGIGLNVDWGASPEPLPEDVAARAVTLAELCGHDVDRAELLHALLSRLSPLLETWRDDPERLHASYRAALSTLGREVRVALPDGEIVGTAVDLRRDGALVVETAGGRAVVTAGDVVHLRSVRP